MDINDEFIVNPNAGKEFLKNLISILIILLIIVVMLIFLQIEVGFGFVTDILAAFEIQIDTSAIFWALTLAAGAFAAIILAFSYVSIRNESYLIHNDRIDYKGTQALVFLQKEDIPFQNITRITFSNEGLMNKLLRCGEVKIELTGLKIPSITLESIDGPDRLTDLIQQKVNLFNMQRQMQYQERQKVDNIMKRF